MKKTTGESLAEAAHKAKKRLDEGVTNMILTPRVRFAAASPADKRKRSRLYRPGQVRLFFDGRKIMGPVKLLGRSFFFKEEEVRGGFWQSFQDSEPVWSCELMFEDGVVSIGEFSLGTELNEMEALAWASL